MKLSRSARTLLLVVGLVAHGFALAQLLRSAGGTWPTASALFLLVAGAVAWGFGAMALYPEGQRHAWWQPAMWAMLFPVIGPLASLGFAAILRRPPVDRSAKRYYVLNEEQMPGNHSHSPHAPGGGGASIVEILQSPRTQLRRNAVLALRELDPQMAIPLLRKGLQDSDEQVRIYAQNILSTMLERFEEGIKQLEQKLSAGPAETSTAKRLAEQYFELVYLDVAGDEETAAHYLDKARALLERVAAASPNDPGVPFLGLRYALRARDPATARRWVQRLRDEDAEAQHVLPWLMELAFLEGDWKRLRAMFAGFRRANLINPRIEELGRFWLGEPPPAP